jgi:hypothetical protein
MFAGDPNQLSDEFPSPFEDSKRTLPNILRYLNSQPSQGFV